MKNESYLVQRLNKPHGSVNPFSFGGGLRNGGLSDEAMDLLSGLFSFDYMGAAEFEFGAVPEALNAIANNGNLTSSSFEIAGVLPHESYKTTIYIICDADDVDEVEKRVRSWVLPYGERPRMKESPMLDRVLAGEEWALTLGWLELDNGWFAFIDREMFEGVAKLFGVEV